jgi:hypothetical protein
VKLRAEMAVPTLSPVLGLRSGISVAALVATGSDLAALGITQNFEKVSDRPQKTPLFSLNRDHFEDSLGSRTSFRGKLRY